MVVIERLESWLRGAIGNKHIIQWGEWYAFSEDTKSAFAAITQVGGRTRADDLRWPHFMVTIVSSAPSASVSIKQAQTDIISKMDSIMKKAQDLPDTCLMLKINPVGEVVGPMLTQSSRIVATVTLEVITTQ